MALTNAFNEAVNLGNVRRIRIMMKDSLLVDPTFREFKEMENLANSIQGLYDTHDGRIFELNKRNWDDNYMDKQMVQVIGNFSHERIEHIKDVVSCLRPIEKSTKSSNKTRDNHSTTKNTKQNYEEQKRRDQKEGRYVGAKVATGAIAGAVAGGVIASSVSVTVVGGTIVGAVIGGVTVSIVSNGGR